MPDRTSVFVDGESHFIRSQNAWRELHGKDACLRRLRHTGESDQRSILVDLQAKVFWTRRLSPGVQRATYFTSIVGADKVHGVSLALRSFDLEPSVIVEPSDNADRRRNTLANLKVIEKPKGVDIALAVRMVEHAVNQFFEVCHLYTSDADFLPAIEAVLARGKQVVVYGYEAALGKQSRLLTVPTQFVDLGKMLCDECEHIPKV